MLLFEELELKRQISEKRKIPFHTGLLAPVILHADRFDQQIMRQLRLSFLNSRAVTESLGGGPAALEHTFDERTDEQTERLCLDFLIESCEGHLANLKDAGHY